MVYYFQVAASKALVAELNQSFPSFKILHQSTAIACCKDVGKELETHLVIVLDSLSLGVGQVLLLQEFNDSHFDQGPMICHYVLALYVFEYE